MQLRLMLPKLLYELKIPCSKKCSKFPLQLEKMLYRQQIWRMEQFGFSGLQFNSKQTEKRKSRGLLNILKYCEMMLK